MGAAALLCLVLAGCGRSDADGPDQQRFEAVVQERLGATDAQAACISDYVFDAYEPSEIDVLIEEGMPALPQARWEPYLTAAIACVTHDQTLGSGS